MVTERTPNYYVLPGTDLDCLDVIERLGLAEQFHLASAFSYLWRAGKKTQTREEDVRKAREYLDRYLSRV